ncbi:MAG TPA: hypothetical protein VMZ27_00415 [Candidatus Saccharimonadales bacterium]|nr:hypothetical protein [Candidatus Saccharimonadales bacterium]
MTFLPIVDRELRVRARLKSTFRYRMAGAFICVGIVVFLLVTTTAFTNPGVMGKTMFNILAWLVFPWCLFEGTRNTADCLSEEKRGGTLGLLFLTDLTAYDVVLGKLVATSLNSFYGLLGVLPALAVPFLLGGVTAGEFWRLVLTLLATLFFSVTTGLLVSSLSYRQQTAWSSTVGVLFFFTFGLPLLRSSPLTSPLWVSHFSPGLVFRSVQEAHYVATPSVYWNSLASLHGLSWAFLVLAAVILPHTWQDRKLSTESTPQWLENLVSRMTNTSGRERSSKLLGKNPVLWLAGRPTRQYFYLWLLIGVSAIIGVAGWVFTKGDHSVATVIFVGALLLNYLIVGWVASQACGFFPEARASGAMELLLSTPTPIKTILEGYTLALKRQFLGPVVALLAVEVVLLAAHALRLVADGLQPIASLFLLGAGALSILVFILDLNAAAYWGMWMGLSNRTASKAMTKTVLYVLIFPMLTLACLPLWPIVGIVKNLILINYAQEQMRRYFRSYVTERFSSGTEFSSWSPLPSNPTPRPPYLPTIYPPRP